MNRTPTHRHGKACLTCKDCGMTFIGRGAIQRWADHSWEHFGIVIARLDQ